MTETNKTAEHEPAADEARAHGFPDPLTRYADAAEADAVGVVESYREASAALARLRTRLRHDAIGTIDADELRRHLDDLGEFAGSLADRLLRLRGGEAP